MMELFKFANKQTSGHKNKVLASTKKVFQRASNWLIPTKAIWSIVFV